jgi:hypothetical protein
MPDQEHPRPVRKRQPKHRHIILAATRSQITQRDDDREPQTEQTIVGLPPRKFQPDRMDARSWFGMTFTKEGLRGVLQLRGPFSALSVHRIEQRQGPPLPDTVETVVGQLEIFSLED